jgi:hypothetical protein
MLKSQSQSQSYFTTRGLTPINSSWPQAPWDPRPEISFSWTLAAIDLMYHPPWREDGFVSWIFLAFRQVYVAHIWHIIDYSFICTIYKSCQYRLCRADHAYVQSQSFFTTGWFPRYITTWYDCFYGLTVLAWGTHTTISFFVVTANLTRIVLFVDYNLVFRCSCSRREDKVLTERWKILGQVNQFILRVLQGRRLLGCGTGKILCEPTFRG